MNSRIGYIGCLEAGLEMLYDLVNTSLKPAYIISITPKKAISQHVSGFADHSAFALKHNIPIYFADKYSLKSDTDLGFFKTQKFDVLIQGGWQRLFPENILQTLSIGAIGVHGSSEFLPYGRGRSPMNWSLIEGKKRFLLHLFLIKQGVDDGDVFAIESFDINEFDTIKTLYYKNAIVTRKALLKFIPQLIEGKLKTIPQKGNPFYYPKRNEEDGKINFSKTVFDIYNLIRALTHPYPGAHIFADGDKVKIWKAQVFDTQITYPESEIGEIVEVFSSGDFVINCYSGLLLITDYDKEYLPVKNMRLNPEPI